MNVFRKFVAKLQLREAIKLADKSHKENGNRYYVMPSSNGKLIVMNRKNFRKLKRKHYISQKASISNLISESFYFTSYMNGNGYLSDNYKLIKEKQFYSWVEAMRLLKKRNKHGK